MVFVKDFNTSVYVNKVGLEEIQLLSGWNWNVNEQLIDDLLTLSYLPDPTEGGSI